MPVFMVAALASGIAVVMVAYFGFDRGGPQILLLLVGAALVVAGLATAMRYR